MNQAKDTAEAAELQSWLVGNARTLRPLDQPGLMGWALAALRSQSEQLLQMREIEHRAADLVEGLEDMDLPGALPSRMKKLRVALNQSVPAPKDATDYDYRTDLACYFGLSYASWLTLPRVLMEAMPKDWQQRMAIVLHEYDDAINNPPKLGTTVRVTLDGKLIETPPWLINYRHPDRAAIARVFGEGSPS